MRRFIKMAMRGACIAIFDLSVLILIAPRIFPVIVSLVSMIPVQLPITASMPDIPYWGEIEQASATYGVDPLLLAAMVKQESQFNPDAVSRAGAMGLGQIMPPIASYCGTKDPFNPEQNLMCAARLFSELLTKYDDNSLALAAYNAGEGAVDSCMCVPINGQTEIYVPAVLGNYREYLAMPSQIIPPYKGDYRTNGDLHGSVEGYWGYDFSAGCGAEIVAPISGMVTYNGRDGYVGPYSRGEQNTMLVISSGRIEVVLLHGDYSGTAGLVRQGEVVGEEASIGNSTGCHTHMVVREHGEAIDFGELFD